MSGPLIRVGTDGPVAIVRFDNPPRGYLNGAQTRELAGAMAALGSDDSVRVVVFTGAVPGVFIRHYDVGEIIRALDGVRGAALDAAAIEAAGRAGNDVTQTFDAIDTFSKPTIAAINGFCQGGGFELALCCDLRITEPGDFRIGLPETNVGIFPGAGGTERLPRLLGEAKALDLILRGRTVAPDEALAIGLVHEVAAEGALARALELAGELAALPPRGIAEAKALIKNRAGLSWEDRHARARARFLSILREDDDADRLMRAFLAGGEDINQRP
jgi:enoyl-CoA hydratase